MSIGSDSGYAAEAACQIAGMVAGLAKACRFACTFLIFLASSIPLITTAARFGSCSARVSSEAGVSLVGDPVQSRLFRTVNDRIAGDISPSHMEAGKDLSCAAGFRNPLAHTSMSDEWPDRDPGFGVM